MSKSDSESSGEFDEFKQSSEYKELIRSRPSVFSNRNLEVVDINTSANLEESYKKGFFNKTNDPYVPNNQIGIFKTPLDISYSFARKSTIDDDNVETICQENIEVSLALKRQDLAKIWKLVSVSLSQEIHSSTLRQRIWKSHPTGWILIKKLLKELEDRGDFQNIAMIGVCLSKTNEMVISQGLQRNVLVRMIPKQENFYWDKFGKCMLMYQDILAR